MKKYLSLSLIFLIILVQPFALVSHEIVAVKKVQAESMLGATAGEYGKCIAMNALIDKAKQAAMSFIKDNAGSLVGGLGQSIGGLGGGGSQSVPISSSKIEDSTKKTNKNTKAQETKDEEKVRLQRKQECFKKVGRKVLVKMTEKTVNWALTGFKGDPFYVKDQGSFINSIEDEVTIRKINELKNCANGNCPYARDTAKALITIEKNKALNEAAQFTLNKVDPNWREFTKGQPNSFSTGGGWKTFLAYTQNSKNNPLGNFVSTSIELNNKKAEETGKIQTELAQNQGFLSLKKCVKTAGSGVTSGINTGSLTNSGGVGDVFDSFGNNINSAGQNAIDCLKYEVITPGGAIREQLFKALNLPVEQKQAEVNQGTDNIEQLANVAIDLIGKGLNKLITSQSTSGGNTIAGSGGQGSNTIQSLNTNTSFGTWANDTPPFQFELEDPGNPGTPGADLLRAIAHVEAEKGYLEEQVTLLQSFAAKTKTLDECLPGPDLNWRARLANEYAAETNEVRVYSESPGGGIGSIARKALARYALERLDALHASNIANIKTSIQSIAMPNKNTIQNQINKITEYNLAINEARAKIEARNQVLVNLNIIKSSIETNPSTIVNGEFIQNPQQNNSLLQIMLGNDLSYFIDDSAAQEEQSRLAELQVEDQRAFSTTPGIPSYMNLCKVQRATLANEVKAKDQGETLFCIWQDAVESGVTSNLFGDPIIPKLAGGSYSQNFDPFQVSFDPTTVQESAQQGGATGAGVGTILGGPIGTAVGTIVGGILGSQANDTQWYPLPVRIKCSEYYKAPLTLYQNVTEIVPDND